MSAKKYSNKIVISPTKVFAARSIQKIMVVLSARLNI